MEMYLIYGRAISNNLNVIPTRNALGFACTCLLPFLFFFFLFSLSLSLFLYCVPLPKRKGEVVPRRDALGSIQRNL